MRLKGLIISAVLIFFALNINGCGGGGNSSGSAAGVSSFSKGVITAKGSITVNGVKFDTSKRGMVKFDNMSGLNDDQLKVGMVVKIKGKINDASKTGIAEKIEFADNLLGPIDTGSINLTAQTLKVFGQTIQVNNNTIFEGVAGLAGLANGNVVKVSGFPDINTGNIVASFVELKSGVTGFEIKGTVSGFTAGGTTFTLTPPNSTTAIAVTLGSGVTLPAGFDNGKFVEVQTSGTVMPITANKVELEKEMQPEENDRSEVQGLVTGVDLNNKTFVVNGITVDASAITMPTIGQKVEVEGNFVNNRLVPTKQFAVEEESEFKIEADVTTVAGNNITMLGDALTIDADSKTIFKDKSSLNVQDFGMKDIKPGDHLEVVAIAHPTLPDRGLLLKVERKNASDQIVLQLPVSTTPPATAAGTFELATVTIDINGTSASSIKDINNNPVTIAAFLNALVIDNTIVKARGTKAGYNAATATLKADEVEIEKQLLLYPEKR